jgi:hypothetical protein
MAKANGEDQGEIPMIKAVKWLAVLGAAGLATAGCANFQDETTVVDLRVLGIKAEPPEIFVVVDLDSQGNVTGVETPTDPVTSQLTVLAVDPQGAGMRPVSYSALACPRATDAVTAATGRNGAVCTPNVDGAVPTSLDVTPNDAPVDTPDLGPVHEIGVPLSIPDLALAAAFTVDTPAATEGFQLPIVVDFQLAAGAQTLEAVNRVIFSQVIPDRPNQMPNQNPQITTITTFGARDAQELPINPTPLPANTPAVVPIGGHLWFLPGGAVAESYSTRVLTRDNPPQVITQDGIVETLRFAFFATAGTFSIPETSTATPPIFDPTTTIHLESQYNAPATLPANPDVTFWIVVRDERGGASWVTGQITLTP